jgi:hypothetical protein
VARFYCLLVASLLDSASGRGHVARVGTAIEREKG